MRNPEKRREEIGGQEEAGAEEFIISESFEPCEREKESKYQSIDDIAFQEVKEGDPDFDQVREIAVRPGESEKEIQTRLREKIKEENWWLQAYWQEKGPPNEQLELTIGDNRLSIYNFGEKITDRHLTELERVVREFSQIEGGKIFNNVRYILIDNERKLNLEKNLDEEQNGEAPSGDKAIKLYPRGMELGSHRIEGASNFEGTLIHEFSHLIPDIPGSNFYSDWINKFGWKMEITDSGIFKRWYNKDPDKCPSKYANYAPEEDICESMVAALRNPGILDPERLQFLKDNLITKIEKMEVAEVDIRGAANNEVKLPTIESPVKFKIHFSEYA